MRVVLTEEDGCLALSSFRASLDTPFLAVDVAAKSSVCRFS